MSRLFTRLLGNTLTNSARGRGLSLLLALTLAVCLMVFIPDIHINLRMQESLFPLFGILMLVCGLIYLQADRATGLFGLFILCAALWRFTPDSYAFLLLAMFYFSLYYIVIKNKDLMLPSKDLIYNIICVFALINALWIFMQINGYFIIFSPITSGAEQTGWFANRNEVGAFLAMATPLFFRRNWHIGLIPIVLALAVTQCLNGLIAAGVVLGVYAAYMAVKRWEKKKALVIVMAILVTMATIGAYMKYVRTGDYASRLEAFTASLDLIVNKPVMGWGIGQSTYLIPLYMNAEKNAPEINARIYKDIYHQEDFKNLYVASHNFKNTFKSIWVQLHNDYLQWAVDAGAVGLLLLMAALLSHVVTFFRTKEKDICAALSVLAALITANAFFTFQIGRLLFVTVLMLAIIKASYREENALRQP
jgi:hypothetical protein